MVRRAGAGALAAFRPNLSLGQGDRPEAAKLLVSNKAASGDRFDPVTEADRSVEREIRTWLAEHFPDCEILGEEDGLSGTGSSRWIIDPIDGTRSFVSGHPTWGTLVGLAQGDRPVAGWMCLPALGQMYWAISNELGSGRLESDAGQVTLTTSAVSELDQATLLCTHPSMFSEGQQRTAFDRLEAACRFSRFNGDCYNYGLLAAGDVELVVENQLQPYDIVPLIPIVEAAGGVITNLDGELPMAGGFVVAAANRELHEAALAVLTDGYLA